MLRRLRMCVKEFSTLIFLTVLYSYQKFLSGIVTFSSTRSFVVHLWSRRTQSPFSIGPTCPAPPLKNFEFGNLNTVNVSQEDQIIPGAMGMPMTQSLERSSALTSMKR